MENESDEKKGTRADVIIGSGMFSIALDLIMTLLRPDLVDISYRVFLAILGAILVVGGTILHENARRNYHDLLEQLKETRKREEEHCKPEQPETIGSLALAQTIGSFQTRIRKLRSEKSDLKVKTEEFRKIAWDQIEGRRDSSFGIGDDQAKEGIRILNRVDWQS